MDAYLRQDCRGDQCVEWERYLKASSQTHEDFVELGGGLPIRRHVSTADHSQTWRQCNVLREEPAPDCMSSSLDPT
jgi:hypothetical protein